MLRPTQQIDRLGPRGLLPGLAVVGVSVIAAFALHHLIDSLSPLVAAVGLGALLANIGLIRRRPIQRWLPTK